ncbi:hypothetical protein [Rhodococcus opacus]|uniref:hypothetical protein n=1 Tax=Rhodococcus opacus TaxID=37919 RepID=UPI0024BB29A4|nr:hypothetical protein [Rhodococcus opacus]MDJ0419598.1 hypothetical protein [Rhodococcus opacus]
MKGFVSQAVPALVSAVSAAGGPVVLTDLSTLAGYGHLHVVREWADLTSPPPHAVWALVPQPEESGGRPGARVDGTALPLNSPEQFVQVDEIEVAALLAAAQSTNGSVENMKEQV